MKSMPRSKAGWPKGVILGTAAEVIPIARLGHDHLGAGEAPGPGVGTAEVILMPSETL